MRFGIAGPATPDMPAYCAAAESLGFDTGWLFDSHMVYSDVYVIMALCAQRTRLMTFGTGVAVATSRIAPVTAHSIATLNRLFPGRVALGLGTGNTGRRTMGFPPMSFRDFSDYARTALRVTSLLAAMPGTNLPRSAKQQNRRPEGGASRFTAGFFKVSRSRERPPMRSTSSAARLTSCGGRQECFSCRSCKAKTRS